MTGYTCTTCVAKSAPLRKTDLAHNACVRYTYYITCKSQHSNFTIPTHYRLDSPGLTPDGCEVLSICQNLPGQDKWEPTNLLSNAYQGYSHGYGSQSVVLDHRFQSGTDVKTEQSYTSASTLYLHRML
jgi:hypothetical protein